MTQLQAASQRFPDDLRIQLDLGVALVRSGRLEEAIAPLTRASNDSDLEDEADFLLGADAFERGDYAHALEECQGLEDSEHAERVLYIVEESNRRLGHLEEAKAAFHDLITRFPESGWTHLLMGNAYEDQQQFGKAIAEYQKALEADRTIPNVDFSIGYLYWRQQDFENARPWFEKEAADGCHSLANFYLGEMARGEKQYPNAERSYKRALVCDASNEQAHLRLGIVLADEKRYPDAIAQLKEAVRLRPDESSAHYHLAAIYSHLGRTAEANAEFKRVREIQAAKGQGVDVVREN